MQFRFTDVVVYFLSLLLFYSHDSNCYFIVLTVPILRLCMLDHERNCSRKCVLLGRERLIWLRFDFDTIASFTSFQNCIWDYCGGGRLQTRTIACIL